MSEQRFVSKKEVLKKVPFSSTTLWRLERAGKFPKRRKISPSRVAWVLSEVEDWIESRVRGEGGYDE